MKKIKFKDRFLHYTETIFLWLVACYFVWQFISIALIIVKAINSTNGEFAYLDTFITETNETFRNIAGVIIVKFMVENVFKHNTFGGRVKQDEEKSDAEMLEEQNDGEDQLGTETDE